MATFSYTTKNKHNGLIEDRIMNVTENDVRYNTIDDFIDVIEQKIKKILKDEDNELDKTELLNEYREEFKAFVETKDYSFTPLIGSIFRKRLSEYIREFNDAFPAKNTFQHILVEKKSQFKQVETFCLNIIKNINISFIVEHKDAVLQWFDEKLETSPSKLKEQQRNATLKWGKQIVKCECGKEYPLYNKHHHIITKHHLNYINEPVESKEVVINENLVMNFIMKDFNLTNDARDFIPCSDIQKRIDETDIKISMTKFGKELTEYCAKNDLKYIIKKNKLINGKAIKCWFGIKVNY